MISRERVRRAFQHQESDRVPRYEQTVCCRIASEMMGRRMRTGGGRIRWEETAARWESEEAWRDYVGHLIEDVGELIRALDFDIVGLPWRHPDRPSRKLDDYTFRYEDPESGLWTVFHYDESTDVFDVLDSALRQEGIAAIERLVEAAERAAEQAPPPTAGDYADLIALVRCAGRDRAVKSTLGGIAIPPEAPWLEACATRPDLVERYLDAQVALVLKGLPVLAEVGVDVLWAGGDLASSAGPMYSPAMFRRFILPRVQRITRAAHEAGLLYLFRTDGDIWPLAQELLVDSGVDGYGEIDNDAGMDPRQVKDKFPHLTLWGGISCGSTLVFDTPQEIRRKVEQVMQACAPGGGYIFGSSNSIHHGVPTRNFIAMQEAAQEFGVYPC